MPQTTNPLKQFFRQPAIYLRLPSEGKYWPEGSLDVPQNGELPVYPMTAIDEITYRTPDALFSGQAVVNVIHSCVPSIKNAWHAPVADLNSILVAIRIASYGHELEIETTCPACKHIESFALDLRNALDQLTMPDFSATVTYGDLEIYFHPMSYEKQNGYCAHRRRKVTKTSRSDENTNSADHASSQVLNFSNSYTKCCCVRDRTH